MKQSILICAIIFFLVNASPGQPCMGSRIQTSAVPRPTEALALPSAGCTELKLSWQGNPGQSYMINVSYTDNATGAVVSTVHTSSIACDKNFNCSVTLPVKPGNKLTWSIQAAAEIDKRSFYSYPLRGEYTGCNESMVSKTNKTGSETKIAAVKTDGSLNIYPNPVTGDLTLKWSSDYKGSAKLVIMDASGKTVRSFDIQKQLPDHLDRITVNTLSSGLYFMQVRMQDGRSMSMRFVKK
jgi:hypothetical protein